MISTETNYAESLAAARTILEGRIPEAGFPEGERDKAIADALNNTWIEGATVQDWAASAAAELNHA